MLVIGSAHKICREESMHLSGVRLSVQAWQQTSLPAGDIDRMLHGAQQMGRVYVVAEHRFVSNTYLGYKAPWYCQTLNLAS